MNRRLVRAAAVEHAAREVLDPSKNWRNRCQEFTRTMLGIGGKYPSAITAWRAVAKPYRHAGRTPPAGVPVYWKGGQYGHAALSAGGGMVFSTDIKRRGKVDLVPLELIEQRWGYHYLGWSEFINDVRVYGTAIRD